MTELRSEAGFRIYKDRKGLTWNVFGLAGQVERIQVDLKTMVHPWSSYENDLAFDAWTDEFCSAGDRLSNLFGRPADYVGYFEDNGFSDEPNSTFLAQWLRDSAPKVMLTYSGIAPFGRNKKQSRLSLVLANGPLPIERVRQYRSYLLSPDTRP